MTKIHCRLLAHSTSIHVQQLYTGLSMLHHRGIIRLKQDTLRRGRRLNHARVILNDNIRLHYDMFDGWKVDEQYLDEADLYFKRSYAPQQFVIYGSRRRKIHPFGLNYCVYPNTVSRFAFQRAVVLPGGVRNRARDVIRSMNLTNSLFFSQRVSDMESAPDFAAEPRIIFMAHTWDPDDDPQASHEVIEERQSINETRAECIRRLRKEFGAHFYGGFKHTKYAISNFKELLVEDSSLTRTGRYVELLRSFPICVATTGLHGSIGWKFAEYVAFSKAIIAEALNYEVPGRLENGVNYLAFDTPQGCVDAAVRLYSDAEFRHQMMTANFKYYHQNLRPDTLVLNTLIAALAAIGSQ